jgi:hypothetical protein
MKLAIIHSLAIILSLSAASVIKLPRDISTPQQCSQYVNGTNNTPTSRGCWGSYSIDDNYYEVTPDTGVTREASLPPSFAVIFCMHYLIASRYRSIF